MVISEMVKRSWSIFKVYLSNVAMELGRHTNFDDTEVELPRLVDDDVMPFMTFSFLYLVSRNRSGYYRGLWQCSEPNCICGNVAPPFGGC
jgi:hypothetical protein